VIRVVIPGEPHAQKRHRTRVIGKHAQAYDHPDSRSWKGAAQVHMLVAMDGRPPLSGPLRLVIYAFFALPKSKHRKRVPVREAWSVKNKDADNLAKAVMDAGNGVLWGDDRQVCNLHVTKRTAAQGEAARMLVSVVELEALDE